MKSQMLKRIERLITGTEYIETVAETLNVLYIKVCKARDYTELNEVDYELKQIVKNNGLEV